MRRNRTGSRVFLLESLNSPHPHIGLLKRSGFYVHAFHHRTPQVDEVVRLRPAAIAADLDGAVPELFAFARRLREDPRTQPVPMVVFSRDPHDEQIESAARLGVLLVRTGLSPGDSKLVAVIRGVLAASTTAAPPAAAVPDRS